MSPRYAPVVTIPVMTTRERIEDRAAREAKEHLARLIAELRECRVGAGLSQDTVGRVIGVSGSEIGRIERGEVPQVPFGVLVRYAVAVGQSLPARLFPEGQPYRDAGHQALLHRLRREIHPSWRWRSEVPFPDAGDRRAWDAALVGVVRIGVEGETHVHDRQATERRIALKERDGGMDRVILLLADTRHHRSMVHASPISIGAAPMVSARRALAALRRGEDPGANAVLLL